MANFVAALSSYTEAYPAWARRNGSSSTTFDVPLEEDNRAAKSHPIAETVDLFAFNQAGIVAAYDPGFFF